MVELSRPFKIVGSTIVAGFAMSEKRPAKDRPRGAAGRRAGSVSV